MSFDTSDFTDKDRAEYEGLQRRVKIRADELDATKWWQFRKRAEAANRYKTALMAGAFWEINYERRRSIR